MTPEALDALDARCAAVMGYSEPVEVGEGRSFRTVTRWYTAFKVNPKGSRIGRYGVLWLRDGSRLYCGKPFAPHTPPSPTRDPAAFVEAFRWAARSGLEPLVAYEVQPHGGRIFEASVYDEAAGPLIESHDDPMVAFALALASYGERKGGA